MDILLPAVINDCPRLGEYSSNHPSKLAKLENKIYFKVAYKVYLRCRLSEAQNHKCCWCGIITIETPDKPTSATIEHVQPLARGGPDIWENMAMACNRCNTRRQTKPIEQFLAELARLPIEPSKAWAGRGPRAWFSVEDFVEFRKYGLSTSRRSKPCKIKNRQVKIEVRKALDTSPINPFEVDSKKWRMFNRYQTSPKFVHFRSKPNNQLTA